MHTHHSFSPYAISIHLLSLLFVRVPLLNAYSILTTTECRTTTTVRRRFRLLQFPILSMLPMLRYRLATHMLTAYVRIYKQKMYSMLLPLVLWVRRLETQVLFIVCNRLLCPVHPLLIVWPLIVIVVVVVWCYHRTTTLLPLCHYHSTSSSKALFTHSFCSLARSLACCTRLSPFFHFFSLIFFLTCYTIASRCLCSYRCFWWSFNCLYLFFYSLRWLSANLSG